MKKKKIIIAVSALIVIALVFVFARKDNNNVDPVLPETMSQEEYEQKVAELTYDVQVSFTENYTTNSDVGLALLEHSSFSIEPIDDNRCLAKVQSIDMRKVLEEVKTEINKEDYDVDNYSTGVYYVLETIRNKIIYGDRQTKDYEIELEIVDGVAVLNDDFINCMYGDIFALYNEELETGLNKLMSKEK